MLVPDREIGRILPATLAKTAESNKVQDFRNAGLFRAGARPWETNCRARLGRRTNMAIRADWCISCYSFFT